MRPTDIGTLVSVGRPTIAPDTSFAVFATSRPDVEANRSVGQLWRVDLPDGEPRRLTRGVADSAPRISPDGTLVAFLRGDARNKPQLYVVSAAGGEPVRATDAPLGVSAFEWAPDGASLGFLARVPEKGRYGSVEDLDAAAESPRRVTGIRWHSNGVGYIADRPAQLFTVTTPDVGAEPFYPRAAAVECADSPLANEQRLQHDPVQLTEGATSYAGVVFTADGTELLSVPDDIEYGARDLRDRLVAVHVDGSGVREVISRDQDLSIGSVAVDTSGGIVLLAHELSAGATDFLAPAVGLFALVEGVARRLTDDTIDLGESGSHISVTGDGAFLVQDRTRGRVRLVRVARDGRIDEVLGGDIEVVGHDVRNGTVLASVQAIDSYGELVLIDERGARALTAFGEAAAATGLVVPREVTVDGRDGYPVHGWVAAPAGAGPYPVILQIHGGPYASYGIHLFDETQVLVDAGYAVVYCNPRGSAGYGREHGLSIRGQMGTVDFADVVDFLDATIAADSRLDTRRVGIMGGSYGGYLTAWTIAHDHRFAGAIVERGFLDPVSFQGTSDIGTFFGDEYVGTAPEDIIRQSPMAVVQQVSTPTLVLHSELDFRCPLEQATRYYSALKRAGVHTEMLIFPGENHELTRAGQPRHRVERFDAVLDWWRRYLPA